MQSKIIPKLVSNNPEKFAGHVVMKHPSFDDRISFWEELGIDMDQLTGGGGEDTEAAIKKNGFKSMRQMARRLKDFLLEVDIRRTEDGYHFDSYDALQGDSTMHQVIMELSFKLMGEFKAVKST